MARARSALAPARRRPRRLSAGTFGPALHARFSWTRSILRRGVLRLKSGRIIAYSRERRLLQDFITPPALACSILSSRLDSPPDTGALAKGHAHVLTYPRSRIHQLQYITLPTLPHSPTYHIHQPYLFTGVYTKFPTLTHPLILILTLTVPP